MWVIEYSGMPECWITNSAHELPTDIDVTFQRKHARRFACEEDARHEILRLGLPGSWTVQPIGGGIR